LKSAVEKHCGERWSKLITKIKNVNEYPSGVSLSKIFIKIVITDKNNRISNSNGMLDTIATYYIQTISNNK